MKFKCKLSGGVTEFLHEWDIDAMLKHPDYEVVPEPVAVIPTSVSVVNAIVDPVVKRTKLVTKAKE